MGGALCVCPLCLEYAVYAADTVSNLLCAIFAPSVTLISEYCFYRLRCVFSCKRLFHGVSWLFSSLFLVVGMGSLLCCGSQRPVQTDI
ncbi:hypothetical protein BGX38DRAFT_1232254 [Terfezia claveryi]|nr:hypothetical protein BGX38DRAFT_1232254 [Terfezia claveryi]